MNGPVTRYLLRLLRENKRLKQDVRGLRGQVAGLQDICDELEQARDRERERRVEMETLHGWLEST